MAEHETPQLHPDSAVIDALGGTTATAKICEVEPQAVSQWRASGIPRARLMYLKLAHPKAFRLARKSKQATAA